MRLRLYILFCVFIMAIGQEVKSQSANFQQQVDFDLSKKHLNNVARNPGDTIFIDGFQESLQALIYLNSDPVLRQHLQKVITYSNSGNLQKNLATLKQQLDIFYKNQAFYDSLRRELVIPPDISSHYDTIEVSSSDSIFGNVLDAIFADSISRDSIQMQMDLLAHKMALNDTLIASLNHVIMGIESDSLFHFVNEIQNDTIFFYLVNIEGDSVLIKLYDNSPELIKFAITDYWGSNIPAVIRNVNKNSMRLLVDDVPEIQNDADEQAKEAMSRLKKNDADGISLTVKYREMPGPKTFWQFYGNTNIDVSQVGMKNWVKGGEPSMSFLAGLELYAKYKKKSISWDNNSRFRYGVLRQGEYTDSTAHWAPNEDRIEITSKFGTKIYSDNHYLTMMADFKSQFAPNYKYSNNVRQAHPVSEFMSPGYITLALGVDYKPNNYTTFYFAPISDKSTFVLNPNIDSRQYGLDSADNVRNELGFTCKAVFKNKVWGNIEMEHIAEVFSNYLNNPQNIDVDWQMKVIFPVNDFIRATLSTSLIYDHDINIKAPTASDPNHTTKAIQFKEMITLGFVMIF